MALPTTIDISRTRGDTYSFDFAVEDDDGNAVDVTGFSFLLTVSAQQFPADDAAQQFQLTGTIIDAAQGTVRFGPLTADQAGLTPRIYYYDLQQTDAASAVRTIARGKWTIQQDVTK